VADNVMAEIAAQGKSLRQVARESGINRTTLHERIHNVRPFNTDELERVAIALGVEPGDFLDG
jgi:lambda repressor-like predicted transcriptional regulator